MRTTHFARNVVSGLVLVSEANHASVVHTPLQLGPLFPKCEPGFLSGACVGYVRMQRWREYQLSNMLSQLRGVRRKEV